MCFTIVNAPNNGLVFVAGRPTRILKPGLHLKMPWERIAKISTALRTEEVPVDVITKGGTPTQLKVGYTARVTDIKAALINVANPFATLRVAVMSVVSGTANSYTIDQLAQNKNDIAEKAEEELKQMSEKHGWGLGNFQIAVGDPSMSEELKRLLMREEAVRRENAANLERARNQLEVARQLAEVGRVLENSGFGKELLRLQMISDMDGKVIVIDSQTSGVAPGLAEGIAKGS